MLRSKRRDAFSRSGFPGLTTEYSQICYKEVKKQTMGSCESGSVWTENSDENTESFVGFIQLLSVKTAMILKSTLIVPYLV